MEYYLIRVYRREPRKDPPAETCLTGLVEDDAGRKASFHDATELWRLLVGQLADAGADSERGV